MQRNEWTRACSDGSCVETKWLTACNSGACIEVGTRCSSGACVEVAHEADRYLVRDSKDPEGPVLTFTPTEWQQFIEGVRAGKFDIEEF